MQYKNLIYDRLLNRITNKDNLFNGNYTLDPYQNCEFECIYCDSSNDKTINIKSNATQLLKNELEQVGYGTIIIGSVHDPYQDVEKKSKITRSILEIIKKNNLSCHILTKSDLIFRDIDILSDMKDVIVTISLTSLDKKVTDVFEKKVPTAIERLHTIKKLSENGIKAGLALIPILPFIVEAELENIVKAAHMYKSYYILHKYLELKGDQKKKFMSIISKHYPPLVKDYERLYNDGYKPKDDFITNLNNRMEKLCNKYHIKNKI